MQLTSCNVMYLLISLRNDVKNFSNQLSIASRLIFKQRVIKIDEQTQEIIVYIVSFSSKIH